MGSRILLVEDDADAVALLSAILAREGHEVRVVGSGGEVERALAAENPALILLATQLAKADGLLLCARLRSRTEVPIILQLGPTRRKSDPIVGLRLGADDFIAKPFEAEEIVARVEAVLRRTAPRHAGQRLQFGDLIIDRPGHQVLMGKEPLRLTPTEFSLLACLASEPERVFTREELAREVWGYEEVGRSRMADVHILRLRQKLEKANGNIPSILTVRGCGYKFSLQGLSRATGDPGVA